MCMKQIIYAACAIFLSLTAKAESPVKMKTKDGKPRYWAFAYQKLGGPRSYDQALIQFREFKTWGATDLIWQSDAGAVTWPTDLEYTFTSLDRAPVGDFKYNRRYDRVDALCRAGQKYGIKLWFSRLPKEGGGMDRLHKYGWEKKGGAEFSRKMVAKRKAAGFYAKDGTGHLIKYGDKPMPWHIYFDLASDAYLKHLKDQLSELKAKYGHYNIIRGFFIDEFELNLVADSLSDDVKYFSKFCKKNFGEEYQGKDMPQFAGVSPKNVWWRREMLFRMHIMNRFLAELTGHAHKLGFEIIKPNRNLEGWNNWTWKCGMDTNAYSSICDYVWISAKRKSQLDPYLNYDNVMIAMGMAYGNIAKSFAASFHGKSLSDHAFPCGTTVNNLSWYTEAERKLFMGHQNNKNWFNLFNSWTGGRSPAKVAIAINSPVFTMQYPQKTKDKYDEYIAPLFEELSNFIDVDGFQLHQLDCLEKYPFIIVPHGVPMAMTQKEFNNYIDYVKNGGIILTINARWTIGKKDMSNLKDVSYDITGCKFQKGVKSNCKIVPNVKWLDPQSSSVRSSSVNFAAGASVKKLASDNNGNIIICEYEIGRGKVISCLFPVVKKIDSGDKRYLKSIAQIVKKYCNLPVVAEGNIQITQTVQKDKVLAVVLKNIKERGMKRECKAILRKLNISKEEALKLGVNIEGKNGKAFTLLKIDANALDILGRELEGKDIETLGKPLFSVKNIITGRTIQSPYRDKKVVDLNRYACSWTADELLKGIPVKLKYKNQFAVIAVAEYEKLDGFAGVMPGMEWVDTKSKVREDMETPTEDEMGLNKITKDKKGIRVGIFVPIKEISKTTYGAKEALNALKNIDGIAPIIINDISLKTLQDEKIEVLIYCQSSFKEDKWIKNLIAQRTDDLRKWVNEGGGLLAKHDVSGYRYYPVVFPAICKGGNWHTWGTTGENAKKCIIKSTHPCVEGFKLSDEYTHSYVDHVQLLKGSQGEVIVIDKLHKKPIIIVGETGKGRFIADGTAGYNPKTKELSPKEKSILVNMIKWLGKK